jgi:hypothetical protein
VKKKTGYTLVNSMAAAATSPARSNSWEDTGRHILGKDWYHLVQTIGQMEWVFRTTLYNASVDGFYTLKSFMESYDNKDKDAFPTLRQYINDLRQEQQTNFGQLVISSAEKLRENNSENVAQPAYPPDSHFETLEKYVNKNMFLFVLPQHHANTKLPRYVRENTIEGTAGILLSILNKRNQLLPPINSPNDNIRKFDAKAARALGQLTENLQAFIGTLKESRSDKEREFRHAANDLNKARELFTTMKTMLEKPVSDNFIFGDSSNISMRRNFYTACMIAYYITHTPISPPVKEEQEGEPDLNVDAYEYEDSDEESQKSGQSGVTVQTDVGNQEQAPVSPDRYSQGSIWSDQGSENGGPPGRPKKEAFTQRKTTRKSEESSDKRGEEEYMDEIKTFVNLFYEMHMSRYLRGEVSWETYLHNLIRLKQQVLKERKWLELYLINWTFVSTLIREQGKNLVGYLLYKAPQSIVKAFCDIWADMTTEALRYEPETARRYINAVYLGVEPADPEKEDHTPIFQRLYPFTLFKSLTFVTSGLYVWLALRGDENFSSRLQVLFGYGLGFRDMDDSFDRPTSEDVKHLHQQEKNWINKKSRGLQKRINGLVKATQKHEKAPITQDVLMKADEEIPVASRDGFKSTSTWALIGGTLEEHFQEIDASEIKRDGENASPSTLGDQDGTGSESRKNFETHLQEAQNLLQTIWKTPKERDRGRESSREEEIDTDEFFSATKYEEDDFGSLDPITSTHTGEQLGSSVSYGTPLAGSQEAKKEGDVQHEAALGSSGSVEGVESVKGGYRPSKGKEIVTTNKAAMAKAIANVLKSQQSLVEDVNSPREEDKARVQKLWNTVAQSLTWTLLRANPAYLIEKYGLLDREEVVNKLTDQDSQTVQLYNNALLAGSVPLYFQLNTTECPSMHIRVEAPSFPTTMAQGYLLQLSDGTFCESIEVFDPDTQTPLYHETQEDRLDRAFRRAGQYAQTVVRESEGKRAVNQQEALQNTIVRQKKIQKSSLLGFMENVRRRLTLVLQNALKGSSRADYVKGDDGVNNVAILLGCMCYANGVHIDADPYEEDIISHEKPGAETRMLYDLYELDDRPMRDKDDTYKIPLYYPQSAAPESGSDEDESSEEESGDDDQEQNRRGNTDPLLINRYIRQHGGDLDLLEQLNLIKIKRALSKGSENRLQIHYALVSMATEIRMLKKAHLVPE